MKARRRELRAMGIPLDDDVWPRIPQYRFRIYARRGEALDVLAATPDASGVGRALVTLDEDCRAAGARDGLGSLGQTGILDAIEGRWIVSPWTRPS